MDAVSIQDLTLWLIKLLVPIIKESVILIGHKILEPNKKEEIQRKQQATRNNNGSTKN